MTKTHLLKFSLLLAIGLALAFSMIVLTGVAKEFTHAGLEGRYFSRFYSVFLPIVWLILVLAWTLSKKMSTAGIPLSGGVGALAGYFGGVISLIVVDLQKPGGWSLVLQQSSKLGEWGFRLVYPILSMNWLVGLAGTILAIGLRNLFNKPAGSAAS